MKNKKFKDSLIPNYNTDDLNRHSIGGHLYKSFYWLKDNTIEFDSLLNKNPSTPKTLDDSYYLQDLFQHLTNGDSSYFTYINDLFKDKKSICIPHNVSCLVKDNTNQYSCYSEVVGSKLANLLGVKTVYNFGARDLSKPLHESLLYNYMLTLSKKNYYNKIVSVDFVPYNHTIESFEDFPFSFSSDTKISNILKIFNFIFKAKATFDFNRELTDLYQIKKDFLMQYMFRVFLCGDIDYNENNIVFLKDKDGALTLGPSMDMEYLFRNNSLKNVIKTNFKTIYDFMPDEVNGFIKNVNDNWENGGIDNILSSENCISSFDKKCIYNRISENIQYLNVCLKECQNISNIELDRQFD